MIEGKTKSGFSFCVDPKTLHSMKVVRLTAEIEKTGSNAAVLMLAEVIFGDDLEKFYDHCDAVATDEKYADEIFGEGIHEILVVASEDKELKN